MTGSMTSLIDASQSGDVDAQSRLFSLLYDDLRRCAHRQRGHGGETLSTTALVHETYVKLVESEHLRLESRQHFMALAARAMRQVLIDHARRAGAMKRGGSLARVPLDEHLAQADSEAADVLALDRALIELEAIDERAARVVQLHFFGGLGFAQIAELESLNERTIKRDWQAARLMLASAMKAHD